MSTATKNKKRLVPQLRFKEFEGEWEIERLRNLFIEKVSNGETVEKSNFEIEGSNFYLVQLNDLFQSAINLDVSKLAKVKLKATAKKLEIDDVIINRVSIKPSGVAKTSLVSNLPISIHTTFESNMFRVRFQTKKINPLFFCYFSLSSSYMKQKLALAKVTNQASLSQSDIGFIKLPYSSSLPEQQKIATFLSSVDQKIQQLTRKSELLTEYKKGVMQQLFSGQLRFKDQNGQEYPKWEEKRLGEVCIPITKGTTPKSFSSNGVNFIKIEGLKGLRFNKSKCLYVDYSIHEKELKRSQLKVNDILFAIAGSIGKLGLVTKDILPANTNQAFAIIRLKNHKYLEFILQVLQSVRMKKYIYQSMSVGAQPNLNLEQIGDFKFLLPDIEEQQKIADFLSGIDAKIEKVNHQITQAQTFKKGLLQQLFV